MNPINRQMKSEKVWAEAKREKKSASEEKWVRDDGRNRMRLKETSGWMTYQEGKNTQNLHVTEGINGEGRKHDRNGARGKENPAYCKHTGDIKKSRAGFEELEDA